MKNTEKAKEQPGDSEVDMSFLVLPMATGQASRNGWQIDPDFLQQIWDKTGVKLEDIESSILWAVEFLKQNSRSDTRR